MALEQRDVSVVICCYTEDRWDDLVRAVESMGMQTVACRELIVVVDHNPALYERARAALECIVVENAEGKGLSGARNTGIATAQGALVAFLDDDAAAAPDWLHWLTDWHEDVRVIGAGGMLEPWWVSGAPRWFPEEFNWVVACSYRGLPETTRVIRNPLGGSM